MPLGSVFVAPSCGLMMISLLGLETLSKYHFISVLLLAFMKGEYTKSIAREMSDMCTV